MWYLHVLQKAVSDFILGKSQNSIFVCYIDLFSNIYTDFDASEHLKVFHIIPQKEMSYYTFYHGWGETPCWLGI